MPRKTTIEHEQAHATEAVRAPKVGDGVVYWPARIPGRPFIPVAREARVAAIAPDGNLTLSVLNPSTGQRFRATVPAEPKPRAPGSWSWPET
jgi:hypothetical protein